MNELDKVLAVLAPVDVDAVEAEVAVYVTGQDLSDGHEPWRITNLGQADWAMQKMAALRAVEEQYRDEVALWKDAQQRASRAAEWFEERLKEWAAAERTKDRKTFPLAHGTVSTREAKAKVAVTDEEAAIAWAEVMAPDAVKVTKSILVSYLGEAAKVGEVVIGFSATDKATGEVDTLLVAEVAGLDPAKLEQLREKMGDGYQVEPITRPAVVDTDGNEVPGLTVVPARVTASVAPLGL